jgi:hypothetical protein
MSMSPMKLFLSTALSILLTVRIKGNLGIQIELFRPDLVPLHTILTSSIPFGASKKEVKESTCPLVT